MLKLNPISLKIINDALEVVNKAIKVFLKPFDWMKIYNNDSTMVQNTTNKLSQLLSGKRSICSDYLDGRMPNVLKAA